MIIGELEDRMNVIGGQKGQNGSYWRTERTEWRLLEDRRDGRNVTGGQKGR